MRFLKLGLMSGSAVTVLALSVTAAVAGDVATTAVVAESTTPAAQQAQAASDPSTTTVDDIVVTANKRAERALEVPGAITAFRGEDLLNSGATSIKDIAGFTPGLQFNNQLGTGSPVIRGLSQGIDTSPTVASVVNGAPIGASSSLTLASNDTLDVDPIDVARVEILKGPQGTLYGANTLGGLVSYSLIQPNLTRTEGLLRTEASATQEGDPSYSVRGAVSTPLVEDQLGVRLSGYYDRRGGFIDNARRNLEDQNESTTWGVHAAALYVPNDRLKIGVDGFHQEYDSDAGDAVVYNLTTHQPRDGDLRYDEYVLPSTHKTISAGVANIDYDLGFANLTSVTSRQEIESNNIQNVSSGTLTTTLAAILPRFGGVAFPTPALLAQARETTTTKTTQELRLTSPGDQRFSWIAGAYYAQEDNDYAAVERGATTTGGVVPTLDPALKIGILSTLKEYSGFVNGTFQFTPRLDVTGGIRVGKIEQETRQTLAGADAVAFNRLLVLTGAGAVPAISDPSRATDTVKTYLASVRYHVSDDGIIFARYATGFRPGGPNLLGPGLPPSFDPDRTTNYELGFKSLFWGGRGSIDITGYYTDWKDIVVVVSSGGLSGYTNGGDARVIGVETALSLRPTPEWTLRATAAYSDGEITNGSTAARSSLAEGDALPYNPKTSASAFAEYRRPMFGQWEGYASGSVRYASSRDATFKSRTSGPTYELPSYTLADLHAGIENDQYTFDVFVKNATDERAQLAANPFYNIGEVTVARPRTFGVVATLRY